MDNVQKTSHEWAKCLSPTTEVPNVPQDHRSKYHNYLSNITLSMSL